MPSLVPLEGKKSKDAPKDEVKKANLEDRIVNTNPILESYGNAKKKQK